MTIVQTYILTAAQGREAALEELLWRLAEIVRAVDGCEGVTILRDLKTSRYVFMETYVDADAHKASAAHVPKQLLSEMMVLLASKPDVMTLSPSAAG